MKPGLLSAIAVTAATLSGCALLDATGGGGGGGFLPAQCGQEKTGVTGKRWAIGLTSRGEEKIPDDLSDDLIAAYVPLPGGGHQMISGYGTEGGTFSIPEVPPGPFILRWNNYFFATECHEVDLSTHFSGNPEIYLTTEGPRVSIEVGGLAPWTSNDQIQLVSASTGLIENDISHLLSPSPEPGSSSLSSAFTYSSLDRPWYIDPEAGDDFAIGQLSAVFEGGMQGRALTRVLRTEGFAIPGEAYLSGFLEPVPRSQEVKMTWRRSEFARQSAAVSPSAIHASDVVYVGGIPGGTSKAFFDRAADLLVAQFTPSIGDQKHTLKYGNPYDGLEPFVQVQSLFEVTLPVPSSMGGGNVISRGAVFIEDAARSFGGDVEPLVGPVSNPQVDGIPFYGSGSIRSSPTFSWSEPQDGEATAYSMAVFRVAGGTLQHFATVYTEGTSVQLPIGILQSGETYHFRLRAEYAPRRRRVQRPFQNQFPSGVADALSGVFTVQ